MTNYSIGRAFEYRVKKYLEKEGFVVFRSAGSHSPADLVALKLGEVWLVQCKANDYVPQKELDGLKLVARELGVMPVLAHRQGHALTMQKLEELGE